MKKFVTVDVRGYAPGTIGHEQGITTRFRTEKAYNEYLNDGYTVFNSTDAYITFVKEI